VALGYAFEEGEFNVPNEQGAYESAVLVEESTRWARRYAIAANNMSGFNGMKDNLPTVTITLLPGY